jgi:phosphate-selective porin OprO and OprP
MGHLKEVRLFQAFTSEGKNRHIGKQTRFYFIMLIVIAQTRLTVISVFLAPIFLILVFSSYSRAELSSSQTDLHFYEQFEEGVETGLTDPFGFHHYWTEGFHLDSPKKNIKVRLYGRILADAGYIEANDGLQSSFPTLEGWRAEFRDLRIILLGTLYDDIIFKFAIDFANIRDIKDLWIGYGKIIPFLGRIRAGHFMEPFSLEQLTGIANLSFMERALPVQALSPGRDAGIMCNNTALGDRLTWSAGAFLLTGSFSNVGEWSDTLSNTFGTALTARVTGLPRYTDDGRTLLHLGFSYSHQFRDDQRTDSDLKIRARPETRLTNDTLVDAGQFPAAAADLFGGELAMVSGPFSLQGEYFLGLADSPSMGNPRFNGFYLSGSYFLTGEHRNYNRSLGVFTGVTPKQGFHLFEEGWGALEAACRVSYVDLNDKGVRGGKEGNFTFGLNWYLSKKSRFMFNFIHARVTDRAEPPIDSGRANIFQVRFQYGL